MVVRKVWVFMGIQRQKDKEECVYIFKNLKEQCKKQKQKKCVVENTAGEQ